MAITRTVTSVRIDTTILATLREEAKADNRSLSNYLEKLLFSLGYRPYNEETIQACRDARNGDVAGVVDTSSTENFIASILGDDKD